MNVGLQMIYIILFVKDSSWRLQDDRQQESIGIKVITITPNIISLTIFRFRFTENVLNTPRIE